MDKLYDADPKFTNEKNSFCDIVKDEDNNEKIRRNESLKAKNIKYTTNAKDVKNSTKAKKSKMKKI